jgi:Leucine-rich repeat (LRR) protein
LEVLRLNKNKIEDIHNTSFENLINLNELYLNDNHLFEIPSSLFSTTTSLRVLDLSDNLIEYIHDGTFTNLKNLEVLSLARNRIRVLQHLTLGGLVNLKQLSLRENRLAVLRTLDLDPVRTNLRELDLSSNILSAVSSNVFRDMVHLQNLNISRNNIEFINDSAFFGLSLDKLSMDGNKLTQLWRSSFRGVLRIAYLDFSSNEILRIETGTFDSFNEFIFVLNLSRNKLTKLQYGMVRDMRYLQVLNLAQNQIDQVVNTAMKDLINLQDLDVSENKFTVIHSEDFVGPLSSLKQFSLQCNTLTRFENFNFVSEIHVTMNLTLSNVQSRSVTVSWPYAKGHQIYWSVTVKCVDSNICTHDSQPEFLPAYVDSHVISKLLPISRYYVCINPVFVQKNVHVEQCLYIMTSEDVVTPSRPPPIVVNTLATSGAYSFRTTFCAILPLIYLMFCICC